MPVEIVRRDAGKKFPSRKLKAIALKVLEFVKQDQAELSLALIGNAEIKDSMPSFVKELPDGCSVVSGGRWLARCGAASGRRHHLGGQGAAAG